MKAFFKTILPRTLFGRSLMILVLPILLTQIITTYVFFDRHWGRMTDRLAVAVAGEIAVIADMIEGGADAGDIRDMAVWAGQKLDLLVSYESGGVLEGGDVGGYDGINGYRQFKNYTIQTTLARALEAKVRRPYRINVDMHEKWVEVSLGLEDGVMRVSLPRRRLFSSSGYIFLLWMMGASVVLLAVAVLFMRNQIRPIRRLAVAAERFGKGLDVPSSFKPEGAREVRQAAAAFLDMHERIRRQIQQRTAMLSGVSHDLRTPLTRMKLQVAMMGSSPDIEALKSDIVDMERMIDAYLDFARGEGGEQAASTDLNIIINRIVSNIKRQGIEIEVESDPDLFLQLRPVAFERCVSNIIHNAAKYGGGHIWVSARRQGERVEITVDDDGPGIPDDKMEDVFRPFYRIDESRNPATGGVGLGLPIAQDIVHGHGGKIFLEKSKKGGLRVVLHVPV